MSYKRSSRFSRHFWSPISAAKVILKSLSTATAVIANYLVAARCFRSDQSDTRTTDIVTIESRTSLFVVKSPRCSRPASTRIAPKRAADAPKNASKYAVRVGSLVHAALSARRAVITPSANKTAVRKATALSRQPPPVLDSVQNSSNSTPLIKSVKTAYSQNPPKRLQPRSSRRPATPNPNRASRLSDCAPQLSKECPS